MRDVVVVFRYWAATVLLGWLCDFMRWNNAPAWMVRHVLAILYGIEKEVKLVRSKYVGKARWLT